MTVVTAVNTTVGCSLVVVGASIWVVTRWIGVVWGRTHRCWRAVGLRVIVGLVMYSTGVYLGSRGVAMIDAQTFSPDSQLVASRPRSSPDSLWQQQMTELLTQAHAHEQQINQLLSTSSDLQRRMARMEKIEPGALDLQLEMLKEGMKELKGGMKDTKDAIDKLVYWFLGVLGTLLAGGGVIYNRKKSENTE